MRMIKAIETAIFMFEPNESINGVAVELVEQHWIHMGCTAEDIEAEVTSNDVDSPTYLIYTAFKVALENNLIRSNLRK